jgi:hypothetical protein
MGFKIGTSYVGCPTCADDIMLSAPMSEYIVPLAIEIRFSISGLLFFCRSISKCFKDDFTDIYKLEQFQKKTLEQFLGLPQQTADPAIYIMLAAECIEQIIHKAIIGLFLRILKDPDSVEYQLALRQLEYQKLYISMYLFPYNLTLTLFLHLLITCFSRSCQFLYAL